MQIEFAHIRERSTNGGYIDFAVFNADAVSKNDDDRYDLLHDLTARTRLLGLAVDKSALAFREHGRVKFYGTPDLVDYLVNNGLPRWTHTLTV
ncbi:MAG TPA: hypothetical protein VIQ24_16455 [Pyrinomonadaceae bacterium]